MLPVPCRPATCHVSTVLYSGRGTRKKRQSGGAFSAMDHAAEQRPVAMLAAAGIAPVTAEAEAAIDRRRLSGRHRGRADQHRGVAAPHLLRRAVVDESQEPGDHAEHAVGPAGRHVTFAERDLDVIEGAELHLVAAPALGLQHAKETGRLHLGDRSQAGCRGALSLSSERWASVVIIACARAISSAGSGEIVRMLLDPSIVPAE